MKQNPNQLFSLNSLNLALSQQLRTIFDWMQRRKIIRALWEHLNTVF